MARQIEVVGGSQDGVRINIGDDPPKLLRLPDFSKRGQVEVYELGDDGRYHFIRYGLPPFTQNPMQPANHAEILDIINELTGPVQKLEAFCQSRGGYFDLTVGKWHLSRGDEVQ